MLTGSSSPPTPPPFRAHAPREAPAPQAGPAAAPEWTRVFHTALVSTRSNALNSFSQELAELSAHPAFQSLLVAAQHYAAERDVAPRQACEEVVRVFRRLDQLWSDYIGQEGLDRIRSQTRPEH